MSEQTPAIDFETLLRTPPPDEAANGKPPLRSPRSPSFGYSLSATASRASWRSMKIRTRLILPSTRS